MSLAAGPWPALVSPALVGALARASWPGPRFIAAVWLPGRLSRRLPASLRCALWWTASLKLILSLAWPAPLALPLLPAAPAAERPGHLEAAGVQPAATRLPPAAGVPVAAESPAVG